MGRCVRVLLAAALVCCLHRAAALGAEAGEMSVHLGAGEIEPLDGGPYLFLDDGLIAESHGVTFTAHSPTKYAENPILSGEKSPTALEKVTGPITVLPGADGSGFRMWYVPHSHKGLGFHLGYGTSADGIHWDLPDLGLVELAGNRHNNVVLPQVIGGDVLLDPRTSNAAERYKAVVYRELPRPDGFAVSFSPDGLHWTPAETIAELSDRGNDRGTGASDVVNVFYDPVSGEYVALFKMWSRKGEYTVPVKRGVAPPVCGRRIVGTSRSRDFRHWSSAKVVLRADEHDPPTLEFYGVAAIIRRGGLWIGFLPCLIDDAPPDGIGWTELIVSRDADTWHRTRRPFLQRSVDKDGAPDHAGAWVTDVMTVGDKQYVYYSAYDQGHKSGHRFGCVAMMRKDGFLSVDGGADGGSLKTRPLTLGPKTGRTLVLNADAKDGEVRVQLSSGKTPMRGYTFDDCRPIRSDGTAIAVQWAGGKQIPETKQPLVIEFQVRKASLFSFGFE